MLDTLPTISTQQLLELPMADTLVITVNNRMAIQLKQTLVTAHRDQARVFRIADVQPWNRFVDFVTERLILLWGDASSDSANTFGGVVILGIRCWMKRIR